MCIRYDLVDSISSSQPGTLATMIMLAQDITAMVFRRLTCSHNLTSTQPTEAACQLQAPAHRPTLTVKVGLFFAQSDKPAVPRSATSWHQQQRQHCAMHKQAWPASTQVEHAGSIHDNAGQLSNALQHSCQPLHRRLRHSWQELPQHQ